jgi:hypothetical protein
MTMAISDVVEVVSSYLNARNRANTLSHASKVVLFAGSILIFNFFGETLANV